MPERLESEPLVASGNESERSKIGGELIRLGSMAQQRPPTNADVAELERIVAKYKKLVPPEESGDVNNIGKNVPPDQDQGVLRARDWLKPNE